MAYPVEIVLLPLALSWLETLAPKTPAIYSWEAL